MENWFIYLFIFTITWQLILIDEVISITIIES